MTNSQKASITQEATNKRMTFIDGLRAIAALMVILPHCRGIWVYNPTSGTLSAVMNSISGYGALGVPIFFVISGFAIAYSTRKAQYTLPWLKHFLLKRLVRLTPPYYAAILVMMLVLFLRTYWGHEALNQLPTLGEFFTHLLYLQGLFRYPNINAVFWTLCIEMQLYIFFGILMIVLHFISRHWLDENSHAISGAFIFLGLLSFARPFLQAVPPETIVFLPYWFIFSAGVIVWWGIEGVISQPIGWIFIAILWMFTVITGDLEVLAGTLTATLIYLGGMLNKLHTWLDFSPLQSLGLVSYSLYIIHVPIISVLLGVQTRILNGNDIENIILFLFALFLSIGAATTMFYLVEVPSIQWSRKLEYPCRN